jgi:DNA anti-recombination protein RmuC
VLAQAIPTAEKMVADIKRAHTGLMTEHHTVNSQEFKAIGDLNKLVSRLRKSHNDLSTLDQKLSSILESSEYRMSASTRQDATKLSQTLEQSKQMIAKSISELTS